MSLSRRRQPRIRYRGVLRIVDKSGGLALDATCLDLSAGGIGVRATGAYAVGSDVVCELEVNGRALQLPGTVAWSEPPPPEDREPKPRDSRRVTQGLYRLAPSGAAEAITEYIVDTSAEELDDEPQLQPEAPPEVEARPDTKTLLRLGAAEARDTPMGICFQSLVGDQAHVLEELLREGEPLTSPVQLFLRGVSTPVSARAETSENGIRLRSALPFLALGSEVRFRVAEGEEHEGRVRSVALTDLESREGPRLEIEISDREAARPAEEGTAIGTAEQSERTRKPDANKRTTGTATRGMTALLGIAIGAAAMWLADRQAGVVQPRPTPAATAVVATSPAPANERASEPVIAAAPAPNPEALSESESQPAAAPASPTIAEAPIAQAVAATPEAAPAEAQTAPAQAPAAPAEAQAAAATAPEIRVEGGITRVFIPMQGSDRDISRYDLVSPGIVVTLPRAHALIPLEDYPVYRGIVRRVWVREHQDGVQVRMVWRPGPAHVKVVFDETGLTLVVRPF